MTGRSARRTARFKVSNLNSSGLANDDDGAAAAVNFSIAPFVPNRVADGTG